MLRKIFETVKAAFTTLLFLCLKNSTEKMFRSIYRSSLLGHLGKLRIIKNLIVISLSFLFLKTGDEGLLMLQTTMNKEKGVGIISMAVTFISYGLTSLLFSSFIVKKLGAKNSLLLAIITCLPFIASNFYPTWITMLPSAIFRGFGNSLLWASQCTYFNEASVLFCKIEKNGRKSRNASNVAPKYENSGVDKEIMTFKSDEQKVEPLSAFDLLSKTGDSSVPNRNSAMCDVDSSPVTLTGYKYKKGGLSENKLFPEVDITGTTKDAKDHNLKIFNDSEFSRIQQNDSEERKEEIFLVAVPEKTDDGQETTKYQTYVDSTKSFFFGIHGLVYHTATVWSSLISYYVLKTGDKEDYNKTTNFSCGANFCSANENSSKSSIDEVPDSTRYLLIGVCVACGIVAPLLILLFLDRMVKRTKNVKLSWDHVFATIKYIKKKDQLFLIPFTIGASLCRGFYMADFTKAYIACAWSTSHIGLITVIYGASSALISIISAVVIKYFGRRSVFIVCHIITLANFVFLFLWNPDAQQPYLFYVQGGIFGMIASIFNSQTKAFYGILFEGDEETAFSSCNLYTSMGWALPFIYGNFFCVSVKIYIVLAFSCTGLLGYLLAERSYSLRNKETSSSE
ncbi:Protein unc-93 A [Araneus ventricosus]|uniref:Protein unc-93 A n=1 Tax=Araneus ventricosus TaxID=182803 RepID=A0A4Y2G2J9_ARAVE|nr:Protein unc-93 A [Araneus ventricosus]